MTQRHGFALSYMPKALDAAGSAPTTATLRSAVKQFKQATVNNEARIIGYWPFEREEAYLDTPLLTLHLEVINDDSEVAERQARSMQWLFEQFIHNDYGIVVDKQYVGFQAGIKLAA